MTKADPNASGHAPDAPDVRRRTGRRWRRWLLWGAAPALLVLLAPTLATRTPLRNLVLRFALAQDQGSLSVESASWGWFTSAHMTSVKLYGPDAKLLLHAPSVSLDKTLVALLANRSDFGRMAMDGPTLHVQIDERSSNLERFLTAWLAHRTKRTGPRSLKIEIRKGTIAVADEVTKQTWQASPVEATLALAAAADGPWNLDGTLESSLAGQADPHPSEPPKVAVRCQMIPDRHGCQMHVATQGVPLDVLQPLLKRFLPGAALAGRMDSDVQITWGVAEAGFDAQVRGDVMVNGLALTAALLGKDEIRLAKLNVPCQLHLQGNHLHIQSLAADCDLGHVTIQGTLNQLPTKDSGVLGALARGSCELTAQLDLARLAQMLPDVMRIRDDTTITSGSVQLEMRSAANEAGDTWTGRFTANHLAAIRNGEKLLWEHPIHVDIRAHRAEQLVVDAFQCRSDFLVCDATGTQDRFSARARCDLGQLTDQLEKFVDLGGWRLTGQGEINLAADLDAGSETIDIRDARMGLRDFCAETSAVRISEPEVEASGTVRWNRAADRLELHRLELNASSLQLIASGTIDRLSTDQALDLRGKVAYDLEQITSRWIAPQLGRAVQLAGRDTGDFEVTGPLQKSRTDFHLARATRPMHWAGQGTFGWQRADVFGLDVGAARVQAQWRDGLLRFAPLDIPLGEGRLTATPTVSFPQQGAELTIPNGPLVRGVRLTSDVSDAALKYIAPVLASAIRSDGHFSLDLAQARIPLGAPRESELAGRLQIHSLRVVPGPLARQFILLARQIESLARQRPPRERLDVDASLIEISQQDVEFHMVDGRVHHRGLVLDIGGADLRTSGSVGVDQTLDINVEIPIRNEWIANAPLLSGLEGQTIRIPIGGTFSMPAVDRRAIAQISGQMARGAAQRAIGELLNNQLDKLLKPPEK